MAREGLICPEVRGGLASQEKGCVAVLGFPLPPLDMHTLQHTKQAPAPRAAWSGGGLALL